MDSLKAHVYEFDEIVIGLTVPSLLYSFIHNVPVIFKYKTKPRFFEYINNSVNLTKIAIMKDNKKLSLPEGNLVMPYLKSKVLEHLYLIQSLTGNIPFDDKVADIRVDEEEKILKITTRNQRLFKYKFNKLRIFDTRGLEFLNSTGNTQEHHYVLDEFNFDLRSKYFYDMIPTTGHFPRNVYMSSDRKKLMSHSLMTPEEMSSPDLSSFFITKSVQHILAQHGVDGKLEWVRRYTEEKDINEYEQKDWFVIDKRDEEEIWKERKPNTFHTWLGSSRSRMVQRMMDFLGQTP
jgi:hypothetical protein